MQKVKRKVCRNILMKANLSMKRLLCIIVVIVSLQNTPLFAQGNLYAAQEELIGSKLWYFEFTEWLANKPSDNSYAKKFKVLEFWATWCKPCLKAIPHMNALQKSFADSNIVFFSI